MTYQSPIDQRLSRFVSGISGYVGNPEPVSMEEIGMIKDLLDDLRGQTETFGDVMSRLAISLVWTLGLRRAQEVISAAEQAGALEDYEARLLTAATQIAALIPPPPSGRLIPFEEEVRRLAQQLREAITPEPIQKVRRQRITRRVRPGEVRIVRPPESERPEILE